MKIQFWMPAAAIILTSSLSPAHAAPTAWPNGQWNLSQVKNGTSSTLLSDSVDPAQVWVLPPSTGRVESPRLVARSANLGFCQNMTDIQGYSRRISNRIAELELEASQQESDRAIKQARYQELRQAQAQLVSSSAVIEQMDQLTQRLESIEEKLQTLRGQLPDCNDASGQCNEIRDEIRRLNDERQQSQRDLSALRSQYRTEAQAYTRAKAQTDAARQSFEESTTQLDALQSRLARQNTSLMDLYSRLAKLEGGFAEASYRSGWDDNINKLREENGRGYIFTKIPTQRARLFIGFPAGHEQDAYLSSLPAVLNYAIGGRSYDPYGDSSEAEMTAMPSDVTASYRLSLVGACPVVFPEKFDLPKDGNGVPSLSVAATYEYPMMFHMSARFSYNLYSFYEQIKRTGESGFLFWKKAYSEVIEKKVASDVFSAKWDETDPDNVIPADKKREIEKEIKSDLMARVMRMMGVPRFDGAPPNLPAVPVSAAIVLADGLQSSCFMQSFYCAGASWALRGLNAMFGNNSAESRFKSETNITSSEEWNQNTVRWKPAVSTFVNSQE